MVNRGENGGSNISTTRISNKEPVGVNLEATGLEPVADAMAAVGELSPEHHTDPPDSLDGEGDIVMEDDMSQGPGLAEDGSGPPA